MIRIAKSTNIPPTLLSRDVNNEKARLNNMVGNNQQIKSKDFDETLYGAADVKAQLREDQHDKCAYCETTLLDKGGGEVEHFRPKTKFRATRQPRSSRHPAYYWLAYEWDNLLCSCHECNRIKSTLFPLLVEAARDIAHQNIQQEQPILLNPCFENPADIMEYRMHKVCPKTDAQGNVNTRAQQIIDDILKLNRADLKELRRRKWQAFVARMHHDNLDFDTMFMQVVAESGLPEEDMEFLGMYTNQLFKNV